MIRGKVSIPREYCAQAHAARARQWACHTLATPNNNYVYVCAVDRKEEDGDPVVGGRRETETAAAIDRRETRVN